MTVDLTRRSARAFSFVQQTQQHRPEPHTPDVVVDLLQSDHLSSQRPPHPTAGLLPADLSPFIGQPQRPARRIFHLRQFPRKLTRRPLILLGRCLSPQRLMRPFVVVDPQELRKALLLGRHGGRRRQRRFCLQRPVHPFVPPVLLRFARLNPFRHNTQLHPPHAQGAQPAHAGGGKRTPVVTPHPLRQSVVAKDSLQLALHRLRIRAGRRPAAEQKSGGRITDGERIAAAPIPASEPALEIDRPDLVGAASVRQRLVGRRRMATLGPLPIQSVTLQNEPHRAFRRPALFRHLSLQPPPQLPRPPTGVRPPQIAYPLLDLGAGPPSLHQRPPRLIL